MTRDVIAKIKEWHNADDAARIIAFWDYASQMRMSEASWAQIKREAKMVLAVYQMSPLAELEAKLAAEKK